MGFHTTFDIAYPCDTGNLTAASLKALIEEVLPLCRPRAKKGISHDHDIGLIPFPAPETGGALRHPRLIAKRPSASLPPSDINLAASLSLLLFPRRLQEFLEKVGGLRDLPGCEEQLAAVRAAIHNFELRRQALLFVRANHFVGLVDGHLRILIAVEPQQRRIARIDVKDRTGEPSEFLLGLRLT